MPPTRPDQDTEAGGGRRRAALTVLSGPSGVGKGSVIAAVRRRHPDVWVSVSVTTRPPRTQEQDGVHYHFIGAHRFAELVSGGELLEHASYAGYSYGTPRAPVQERLERGEPGLLEIDMQGARQVRAAMPDAQLVFLAPPNLAELERRLTGRGTEAPDRLRRRLDLARIEMASEGEFDVVIINRDVEAAADELVTLLSP